ALERTTPNIWNFRDRDYPRANIFASLGIVGGSRQQCGRRIALPLQIPFVKGVDGHAELLRIAADLIQGRQPVIDIEGGVFQAFGHNWAGKLLELEHEVAVLFAPVLFEVFWKSK